MPFLTNCPSCSRQLRVPDALAGRNVKCPDCGTTFPAGASGEPAAAAAEIPAAAAPHDEYHPPVMPRRDNREIARSLVTGPAIVLIVVSALHIMAQTWGVVRSLQALANKQA